MKKIIFLFLLSLVGMKFASAQDTIYKYNKEIIVAKITEIGTEEVKYKLTGYEDGPVIVIDKNEIWKIVFANGLTQIIREPMFDASKYASQHKNAVKIDFLSMMFYKLTLGFERSIRPGMSYETTIGVIGVGVKPIGGTRTSNGAFARFGVKFIKSPDFYVKGMRYSHILKGSYVKPEVFFGAYHDKYISDYYNYGYPYYYPYTLVTTVKEKDVTFGGVHLAFGKQWVFNDIFLIDHFISFGYVFDNLSESDADEINKGNLYGTLRFSQETPFSISLGLKIGMLF